MNHNLILVHSAVAVTLLVGACSPIPSTTSVAPSATAMSITGATPAAAQPPSASAPTTEAGQAPAAAVPDSGPVALQVLSPQDGDVVDVPQITVSGLASPGAVVTVDDQILLAGPDGTFQAEVALDEGPNLIEVIASNDSGSESTVDMTVVYEP